MVHFSLSKIISDISFTRRISPTLSLFSEQTRELAFGRLVVHAHIVNAPSRTTTTVSSISGASFWRVFLSQGEQTGRKRIKKLELVISGLREQVSVLGSSEQKAVQEKEVAEARATAAEVSELELRRAVEVIKSDFEVQHARTGVWGVYVP